jgi:hypothetical protein
MAENIYHWKTIVLRQRTKLKRQKLMLFAERWTFSEEEEQAVIESGALTESDIIDFAQKFGTHPAMIIGRFHHKKLLPYHIGRQFIQPE